ncbi:MAG TPA: hypothetical protein VH234_00640 [Candidatus Saccharimonadales bacterium]|nr:hypothetical protein [Candidatus Saccharimonadales bacterium]
MNKYRTGLTALGVGAALAACGAPKNKAERHPPVPPPKVATPLQPNQSTTAEARKLAQTPRLARALLSGPLAKLNAQLHSTRTAHNQQGTTLEYIRTNVCAVVGYKIGRQTLAFYIEDPAYVYRAYPSHPGLVLGALAGVDQTGYLVRGQERVIDTATGQVFPVSGRANEIDITQSSPNLELQPVRLRADNEVFNTHGQRVMSLAGSTIGSESLTQIAQDPLTQIACFGGNLPQPGASPAPLPAA